MTFDDPVARAAEWAATLEGADPEAIVGWAVARFGDGVAIGSGFGKDGLVVIDLARRLRAGIPVLFLETGYEFPETLGFREELRRRWGTRIVDVRPSRSVAEQDAALGPDLYARDPDRCCRLRKVEPLHRALSGWSAWMTGLRRSQHPGRARTPAVEWQALPTGGGLFKINPLVAWSRDDVEAYLVAHDLPRHPLWARGYPSVGCAPCTTAVGPGEEERAGRWRGRGKVECGIHVPSALSDLPESPAARETS